MKKRLTWRRVLICWLAMIPAMIGFIAGFGFANEWSWGVWGWYFLAIFLTVDFVETVFFDD